MYYFITLFFALNANIAPKENIPLKKCQNTKIKLLSEKGCSFMVSLWCNKYVISNKYAISNNFMLLNGCGFMLSLYIKL